MMRTRVLWFTLGFACSSAAMAQFVFKDLWVDRSSLPKQVNEQFVALDTRVSSLELLHGLGPKKP